MNYQFSHDQGTVPQDWRDAHISPAFKKGERHQPSNNRPVSLASVVSKIMEHIILSSIMRFFNNHKILHDCQHGFRSKRSCETQLIGTLQSIASKLKVKSQVDVIQLDFSKSFDKVPHQRLMYKLQFYGVRGSIVKWIQSFLSNRKQKVLLEGEMSSEKYVLSGVPQGTVLRHTLMTSLTVSYHLKPSYLLIMSTFPCGRLPTKCKLSTERLNSS